MPSPGGGGYTLLFPGSLDPEGISNAVYHIFMLPNNFNRHIYLSVTYCTINLIKGHDKHAKRHLIVVVFVILRRPGQCNIKGIFYINFGICQE